VKNKELHESNHANKMKICGDVRERLQWAGRGPRALLPLTERRHYEPYF
jgi:hypothetical protein